MKLGFQWCWIFVLVGTIGSTVTAQDAADSAGLPGGPADVVPTAEGLAALSTLESVRSRMREDQTTPSSNSGSSAMDGGDIGDGGMMGAFGMSMGMSMETTTSAKQLLLQHINRLRQNLNSPNQNRERLEAMLREVLAEYFVLDMQDRVRELDKVKARVEQMESKLQARLDQRQELVEFQIKQMLYKADGLDFVVPERGGDRGYGAGGSGGSAGGTMGGPAGMSGMMGPMGMMDGMMGGAAGGGYGAMVVGYDVGFKMTRFARLPGQSLEASDPLVEYLAMDNRLDTRKQQLEPSTSDESKLKALLLAMHEFHDTFQHFPASANRRDRSEQPHSWRVALLPLLGYPELYKQYRFEEPWDSINNRMLLEKMPAVFGSEGDANAELRSGMTRFQMLVGNGAAFDASRPTEIRDITDGTSNTIAIVVASADVPWTKPADVQFVPNKSLAELAENRVVGMCDGRVETLPAGLTEPQLDVLVTRCGGERR